MSNPSTDDNRRLYLKLLHSDLFKVYQQAFVDATGLPLVLRFPGASDEEIPVASINESPFCNLLKKHLTCGQCQQMRRCIAERACGKVSTLECFAGLRETAIPVRLGKHTIAHLETGQVFLEKPTKKGFAPIARALLEDGLSSEQLQSLSDAYMATNVISAERYRGAVTLLNAFALQLGDLANRIVLEHRAAEPAVVRKAKDYILANLDSPLRLDDVAAHANVSSYYFCKVFKQATGITFTEFVNRQRVERARRLLVDPETRVTEIAYDVGFQSLSQFNRSFLKIVGESPTEYRRRLKGNHQLIAA